MKALRIALPIALLVATSSAMPSFAHAAVTDDPPTVAVNIDGLDLTTKSGAATLYSRLRGAARQVCVAYEGRQLRQQKDWRDCYNAALSNAVLQVNREAVTALHFHGARNNGAS